MQLKASINGRLRRALIGVTSPSVELFDEWVAELEEVALGLEALADYRPRNSALTVTMFGAPKSGTTQMLPRYPATDGEGDITMSGTNAIIAAIQQLAVALRLSQGEVGGEGRGRGQDQGGNLETTLGVREETIELPRAPWRIKEELRRLISEGKCVRCTIKGHFARNCPVFRRPQRPKTLLNSAEEMQREEEGIVLENENPLRKVALGGCNEASLLRKKALEGRSSMPLLLDCLVNSSYFVQAMVDTGCF
ncbi:hypothetical protein K3495_g4755 [Podosphaera aphanis]|nr:hypothetical protein K3495_g4755 [Podosphaera aphanis]